MKEDIMYTCPRDFMNEPMKSDIGYDYWLLPQANGDELWVIACPNKDFNYQSGHNMFAHTLHCGVIVLSKLPAEIQKVYRAALKKK